jgi:hypothetical protein
MTVQPVAPCYDCGHVDSEIGEFERHEHDYHQFVLWGHDLVLCDFCDADFGSYHPEYWGLPAGPLPNYPLELVGPVVSPKISEDHVCPQCKHRLAFLKLLSAIRKQYAA